MKHIKIFGDFFGEGNIEDIEKALIGKKHNTEEIQGVIDNINIKNYFGNIDKEDFLELFFV